MRTEEDKEMSQKYPTRMHVYLTRECNLLGATKKGEKLSSRGGLTVFEKGDSN